MASTVRRPLLLSVTAGALLFVVWVSFSRQGGTPKPPVVCETPRVSQDASAETLAEDLPAFQFRLPTGNASEVSCADMHSIVEQVDSTLAYEPDDIDARELVDATLDWIDPHGLWAIAEDAPLGDFLTTRAKAVKKALHAESCTLSDEGGGVVETWSNSLRATFEASRQGASTDVESAATEAIPNHVNARTLAEELGRRMGSLERRHGIAVAPYVNAARDHFFPQLSRERWGNVVRAALVRAYVPLVDPHGAWAPLDEEASLYEVDLAANAPHALFGHIVPTVIGARVEGVAAPFEEGDVVLELADLMLAGLPLEQLDQLGFALDQESEWSARVIRRGQLLTLHSEGHVDASSAHTPDEAAKVETARVPYGDGEVLVIAVHDVRDDLGRDVGTLIREAHAEGAKAPLGIVIDLRGNGGGSTDGAAEALGAFLPGAPLFPMKRRDGTVEVERAPEPASNERWTGPVAAIVDNGTASAAEMISGALLAYERGVVVGSPTFGKGCAQEYLDDDARTGVLRLTTLVYSLPDGQPVQRVGLQPLVRLTFEGKSTVGPSEREAKLAHSAKAWRGPDVRDPGHKTWLTPWPSHQGNVGPCADEDLCRAVRAIAPTPSRHAPVAKGH